MPRPPGFQRDDVLSQATDVFWARGYGATSISDLVQATGLKPGSLYAAFGSKKGLFLEVLDAYHADFMREVDLALKADGSALNALERLLTNMADRTLDAAGERGCLAVNALLEMAHHDPEIAASLRAQNERLRCRLQALLEQAGEQGELHGDPQALSVFVLNNLWGMRVLCKSVPTREAVDGIVHGVLAALRAPA